MSTLDLDGIAARWGMARMAGEAAVDGGEGWDDAKIHMVVRSWQDVHDLYQYAKAGADVRAEVIATVERFRRQNPMNGDGSNATIDQILGALATTDELAEVVDRVKREHREQWDRDHRDFEARYNRERSS